MGYGVTVGASVDVLIGAGVSVYVGRGGTVGVEVADGEGVGVGVGSGCSHAIRAAAIKRLNINAPKKGTVLPCAEARLRMWAKIRKRLSNTERIDSESIA